MKQDCLLVFKGEDQYVIRYTPGQEEKLYVMLKEYGDDDGLNITASEVTRLIKKLKKNKPHARRGHLHTA